MSLSARVEAARSLGEAVCAALRAELARQGLAEAVGVVADFGSARFELERDPYTGDDSLKGCWRDARGHLRGSIVLYPDGRFYAEQDVFRPHPGKPRWVVEAITAWGSAAAISAETRLLPAPD